MNSALLEADPGRSRQRGSIAPPGVVGGSESSCVHGDWRDMPGLCRGRQAGMPEFLAEETACLLREL